MTKEETNAIKTFNERLGDWMLEEAEKERERQFKMIEEAGRDEAIKLMNDFGYDTEISVVYAREYLEIINGLRSDKSNQEIRKSFNECMKYRDDERDKRNWHNKSKWDENYKHRGYTMEFLNKWYSVKF